MSAKKAKRNSPAPENAATPAPESASPAADVAWIDSPDPKKRQLGKLVLAGVWLYVAALCLLALDQWFHLGIFGPKVPPVP